LDDDGDVSLPADLVESARTAVANGITASYLQFLWWRWGIWTPDPPLDANKAPGRRADPL